MTDTLNATHDRILAVLFWDLGDPSLEYPTAILSGDEGHATWIVEFNAETFEIKNEWHIPVPPSIFADAFDMIDTMEMDKSYCEVVTEREQLILKNELLRDDGDWEDR